MIDTRSDLAPQNLKRKLELEAAALDGKLECQPARKTPERTQEESAMKPKEQEHREQETAAPDLLKSFFPNSRTVLVTLDMKVVKVRIQAEACSITDVGLALITKSDTFLEPEVGASIAVCVGNKTYDVIYLGGSFRFQEAGYNLVTFLLKDDEEV